MGIALLCSAVLATSLFAGCSSGSSSVAAPWLLFFCLCFRFQFRKRPSIFRACHFFHVDSLSCKLAISGRLYVIDLVKEYTNVDFNITSVDTEGFSEKLNLTMASGELPDLIYLVGNAAVQQYGPQGAFINILDYIDQMPNFKAWYEENTQYALNFMSADGALYQFPEQGVDETNRRGWLYRADVFEELWLRGSH